VISTIAKIRWFYLGKCCNDALPGIREFLCNAFSQSQLSIDLTKKYRAAITGYMTTTEIDLNNPAISTRQQLG